MSADASRTAPSRAPRLLPDDGAGGVAEGWRDLVSRRGFFAVAGAALGIPAAFGTYAFGIEPHWVETVRRPMPIAGLPSSLAGRTLLQLSDLHVGPEVDDGYLVESLQEAARLAPDFVALTGDFVTWRGRQQLRDLERVLRALPRGRLGTVASLGNHDYGDAWREMDVADAVANVVRDAGATVLRNDVATIAGLRFAGLGDFWSPEYGATALPAGAPGAAATLARLRDPAPTVVLCHNPDALDGPGWDGVRAWVLAGHTHGGQCKAPFLPPPLLPIRNERYAAGEVPIAPGRTLYVNRGLGHLIRVRVNVRPEMTLFTLQG